MAASYPMCDYVRGDVSSLSSAQLKRLERLEKDMIVPGSRLRAITKEFSEDVARSLSGQKSDLAMITTWCPALPTGDETGSFLAVDMGGTNLRVCEVRLGEGRGEYEVVRQVKTPVPQEIREAQRQEIFWDHIAQRIGEFTAGSNQNYALGFTFSFPFEQNSIDHGMLVKWTKDFAVKGVEQQDISKQFRAALARAGVKVRLVAIVNDTTGTLASFAYINGNDARFGCIFGTGMNVAYFEKVSAIKALHGRKDVDQSGGMILNTECGNFGSTVPKWTGDEAHSPALPITAMDKAIDDASTNVGHQYYEKMISGRYLGEMLRRLVLDFVEDPSIAAFKGQDLTKLREPYVAFGLFPTMVEKDTSSDLSGVAAALKEFVGVGTSTHAERVLVQQAARLVGLRSARLSAVCISGVCLFNGWGGGPELATKVRAGADGTIYEKYPHFRERQNQAFREIFGWPEGLKGSPVSVEPAFDGSGVGAALVAAIVSK